MVQYFPVITGSLTVNGNLSVSGNVAVTGSMSGTSSLAANAELLSGTGSVGFTTTGSFTVASSSLSSRTTQIESVYATTGSNSFRATQSITGSLTVTGQIIAQTINVQQVTSSIVYSSGSNVFGCDLNSRQTFTGSVLMTGSLIVNTTGPELQVNNNGVTIGNLQADNHSITGSLRITGSLTTFSGPVSINQTSTYSVFNLTGTDCGWGEGIVMNPAPNGYSAIHFRFEGRTGSCVTCTWQLGKETSGSGFGELLSLNKQGLTGGKSYRADASQQWKTNGDSIFGFNVGIGTCTPSTLVHVNTVRTSGTNVDIMTLSDNVTGVQTSGFGVRILATSNNGQAKSAIAFEADGGTNNDTAIAFYTQTSAASLDRRMTINKNGNIIIGSDKIFGINTTDGSDNGYLALAGAGADGEARGGHIYLSGNERSSDPGTVVLSAGNVSGGSVIIRTGAGTERMRVTNGGIIYALNGGVDGTYQPMIGGMYSSNNNETNLISTAVSSVASQSGFRFDVSNGAGSSGRTTAMTINRSSVTVNGSLSKGSGTFNIEHPLDSKKCTHRLVHSFIEGPQADLIYRGKINLDNGIACVNIDCSARMTEGTFEALNRCTQVFTTNESSWDAIRGKLHGNILVIESQNTESNDEISWMVIGQRQDKHMFETEWTDEEGRVITEPEIMP